MADKRRSPFGELVYAYRTAMNLTQAQLANRANSPAQPILGLGTVSMRTISSIEKRYAPGEDRPGFSPHTVEALAIAFDLKQGSPEWDEFLAAYHVHRHDRAEAASQFDMDGQDESSAPTFVVAGREKHLTRPDRAIDAAVAGIAGVLFVGANPGTGKTSLIRHAARQAVDRHPGLSVLWGDCTSRSVASDSHQPFRQALDIMAGNLDAASPHQLVSTANRSRLAQRLPHALAAIATEGRGLVNQLIRASSLQARVDDPSLDPTLSARLASLVAMPASAVDGTDLNEQVFRTLAHYAAAGPTMLILEDLHWADTSTSTLVFHLVRRLQEQTIPLLVVGSFRSQELDLYHQPGDRAPFQPILRESTRFFVDPVVDMTDAVGGEAGRAFVNAIVDTRLESAPDSLRDTVFDLTEGLPLFVGAIIRWYEAERKTNGLEDGAAWQPDLSSLPTEIDALFANLIDRLPEHLQALLEAASVQGPIFSAEVVQRVAGLTRFQMIEQLDRQLIRRFHVVVPSGSYTMSGISGHNNRFIHALLRDYLYYRMTESEREHLHEATAVAMIYLYGEEAGDASALIAYHYEQAGQCKAAGLHYLHAGNHALDYYDYFRARTMFQHIQELDLIAIDPFPPIQAMVGLGNCARGNGDPTLARSHFANALELARRHTLPLVQANALTSLGMLDFDAGNMRQGAERLRQSVSALFEVGDLTEACRSLSLLSLTLHGFGQYDEAAAHAARALELARKLDNDTLLTGALIALGNGCLDTGQYARAMSLYSESLALCLEMEITHRAVISWLNLSLCHLEMGQWAQAWDTLAEVFAKGEQVHPRLLGAAEFNTALISELTGDADLARHHYRKSLDLRKQTGQAALVVDSQAGLLRIALAQDRRDDISMLLDSISTAIAERGVDGIEHLSRLYVTLAHAWNAVGRPDLCRQAVLDGKAMLDERAAHISDPAIRALYLENVSSNRAVNDLARLLAIDPSVH
jgi:tetratricopeptide (TPR) repeat protein/transcriptional regulator with XRE-family HTH domain